MREKHDSIIFSLFKDERNLFYYESVVSSFSVLRQFGDSYQSLLVVRENLDEFYSIVLNGLTSLSFGKKVCLRCGKELDIEETSTTFCNECTEEHEK
ncbi:MAG: hypothetical protein ACTSP3_01730, partial [Candidatus Heimdallarchaeaceae archaeon]